MEHAIEIKNVTKAFENKVVLKNLSFSVRRGEIFGFLGPSGSGKTTTIKLLTAQLLPTSGDITLLNQFIRDQKKDTYMNEIGILTDNSTLYERLTIYDNLLFFCQLFAIPKQRIEEVLEVVNLQSEKKSIVKKLSKGMKQRVLLARALLHKPSILFLDEPTSALDPVNTKHIYSGLRQLNENGTTIFLTTHDMYEAEELCDRVAFLHKGEISLLDTPKKLRLQHANDTITLTLQNNREITVNKDEKGANMIKDYMMSGELVAVHSNEPTLGDLFVQLTGREL
ncbi:ABC transporter ATP-binding protein [Priestia koreensis]|uniref:ABC transporter ATP-binding protein n=1 Tax=Priestia koreensis TaxID=284581 RepID=UPI002040C21F|nr:ABC transporter ATP-binding protein [Priestia koreensis]MCM3005068.1 ABC transporter ATP-binding protein [Priestia koreensis]